MSPDPPNDQVPVSSDQKAPKSEDVSSTVQVNQISSTGLHNSPPSSNHELSPKSLQDDEPIIIEDSSTVVKAETKGPIKAEQAQTCPKEVAEISEDLQCKICSVKFAEKPDEIKKILHLIMFHFKSQILAKQEIFDEKRKGPFHCNICAKECDELNVLAVHAALAHEKTYIIKLYQDTVQDSVQDTVQDSAKKTMVNPTALTKIAEDEQKVCPHCQRFFPDQDSVKSHVQACHPSIFCFKCQVEVFEDFNQHIIKMHKSVYNDLEKIIPENSTNCSRKCKIYFDTDSTKINRQEHNKRMY